MACITAKLDKNKAYSRYRNNFVRKIVCQDEDAPEVNNFSKPGQQKIAKELKAKSQAKKARTPQLGQ